ncbi:MAG: DUF885 domain-containing protein [Parvularculaceae bacterium]
MNKFLRASSASLLILAVACGQGARKEGAEAPAAGAASSAGDAVAAEAAAAAFDERIVALTRAYFAELPEMATYYGAPPDLAPQADAKLNDRSFEADAARREKMESLLAELKAVDEATLDARRKLTRDILVTQLDSALAPARVVKYGEIFGVYGSWFSPYAVMQNSGPTVDVANLLQAQQRVSTPAEAEAYLARLAAYGPMIDGAAAKMRKDAASGATPPDFILQKSQNVLAEFAKPPAGDNVLASSFKNKLAEAGVEGADAFATRAAEIVEAEIYPANARLSAYLGELKATATHDAGIWRLPNGAALYQAMIRQMTDTDLTADEIHQIGLDEVARITADMDAILKAQGYAEGSVGERMRELAKEERFFYPNTDEGRAQILSDIQKQLDAVNALAPAWFGVLPKYSVEVRRVPEFSEDSAPGGYYDSPALDGSRPGIYWINLRDTGLWPKFAVPTLTYHESVPGHHLQNAIALGQDAPLILSVLYSNAYGEGWALYCEALAKEMGLYDSDPFGDLGRLQDELHRAIRLVVDTGMHAKKWSREEAIDYMAKTEGAEPSEVESEIERYVVWPGQALGYKIGMLRIQELRKRASEALGSAFDIRAFHDEVLRDGAVPLAILESKVDAFIEAARRGGAPASP